jgi:hypothetical protein
MGNQSQTPPLTVGQPAAGPTGYVQPAPQGVPHATGVPTSTPSLAPPMNLVTGQNGQPSPITAAVNRMIPPATVGQPAQPIGINAPTPITVGNNVPASPIDAAANRMIPPSNLGEGRGTPTGPTATAPGAQPKGHGSPAWLSTIGKLLPLALVAAAGRGNPAAAGAALEGWNAGQARNEAEAQQQAAVQREGAQQGLENSQRERQLTDTETEHADLLKKDAADNTTKLQIAGLRKAGASAYDRLVMSTPDAASASAAILADDKSDPTGEAAYITQYGKDHDGANPYYAKQETPHQAEADATSATAAEARNRHVFSTYAPQDQQTTLNNYKGAPDHFKHDFGFTMPTAPINDQSNVLAAGRLKDEDLNTATTTKGVMARIAQYRAANGLRQQEIDVHRAAQVDAANLNAWKENGGVGSVSKMGSPWGKTFDGAVADRTAESKTLDGLSKQLRDWREKTVTDTATGDKIQVNKGKPDPPDLVQGITASENRLNDIDGSLSRMATTSPPLPKNGKGVQTQRSQAYKTQQQAQIEAQNRSTAARSLGFQPPSSQQELDALPPAQKSAYIAYARSLKRGGT